MKQNNIISNWLKENSNPEIDAFIAKNLAITEKIRRRLEEKNWTNVQLANAMNKTPSEISKWLSGMHNLTLKSIIKMEIALGIELIHTSIAKTKTQHKTKPTLKKVKTTNKSFKKQTKSKAISVAV